MKYLKKILILFFILAVILGGVFLWKNFFVKNLLNVGNVTTGADITETDTANKEIILVRSEESNIYTYRGTLSVPTPCHVIKTETLIAESYPEQVTLRLETLSGGEPCAEVISDKEFSVHFTASPEHRLSVVVNNEPSLFLIVEESDLSPIGLPDSLELVP